MKGLQQTRIGVLMDLVLAVVIGCGLAAALVVWWST